MAINEAVRMGSNIHSRGVCLVVWGDSVVSESRRNDGSSEWEDP